MIDETRSHQDLHTMTNSENVFIIFRKLFHYADDCGIVSQVFRCPATRNQHRFIIGHIHIGERNFGFNQVSLPFNVSVPARLKIMNHKIQRLTAGAAITGTYPASRRR